MTKKQRATLIKHVLDAYFPKPEVSLQHTDPYTLLVAVVLSGHSTDARVNLTTPLLFAAASTPQEMKGLQISVIESIIKPCGLWRQKARAIKEFSRILVEKHDSKVPTTFEELEALPGVGHKSAAVVLAQGFNIPTFPVDTHIFRCARRWKLSSKTTIAGVEEDLKSLFPKKYWINLHLQIIYFARAFCTARAHSIDKCPICHALASNSP